MLYFWFFGWDADCHPLGSQRFPQPTRVITSVCQKRTDIGKKAQENGWTFVVLTCPSVSKNRTGRPWPSQAAWSLEFSPPFVRPIRRGESPFWAELPPCGEPRDGWSRSSGSHQKVFYLPTQWKFYWKHRACSTWQSGCTALCAGLIRCILPLKSVLDDVDNAAGDTPVIHTGSTVRTGKERFDKLQLTFGKMK